MLTAVMPGDCVTAVRLPIWSHARIGTGFYEVSTRKSDFAFAAAAAQVALDDDGECVDVALGIGGVGDRAVRLDLSGLVGGKLDSKSILDGVREAATILEPTSDLHASADYRMRAAVTLEQGTRRRRCRRAKQADARSIKMKVALTVNGRIRDVDVEPRKTLLDVLREDLALVGSHAGCEHGVCGACTSFSMVKLSVPVLCSPLKQTVIRSKQ